MRHTRQSAIMRKFSLMSIKNVPRALVRAVAIPFLKKYLGKLPVDFLERYLSHAIQQQRFSALFLSRQIAKREDVWDYVVETIGASRTVLFLEFGVWEGYSIGYFAKKLQNPGSKFYGFDSFEGLPEDWGNRSVGTFSTRGAPPIIDDSRVSFVKGWFHCTVPSFEVNASSFDVVLVHLDADLYSSTIFVLSQLWLKVNVCYVVFDEFNGHEARALYNFSQSFPCRIEFLAHDASPFPRRVFCRITRRA